MDVPNLLSNLPHDLGLTAIKCWIDEYLDLLHEIFSKGVILKYLQLILESNFMNFHDVVYRQKLGTAMGTKVATTYATLALGLPEEKIFETLGKISVNTMVIIYVHRGEDI